ncbi:conserved protein of unknown function precursor containing a T9SS type A C-terminal secretion signal. Putative extracellular ribonuclease [Tenacibaculum sp. 190524A02b]|uniref:endonuclease n=1 Tax=Tenacibaculum vairaonense TaxID=3137860 RepID=UPI0032B1B654
MTRKLLTLLCLFVSIFIYAQIPTYYNDVNLSQTGNSLKNELATKIIATHTNFLSYTPEVWNALKQSDLDPNNSNKVLLIYGYNDNDGVFKTDRTRDKNDNGGTVGTWNREHVYPKSLGNPNLGTSGPGSDAHSLRPCDSQMNSTRNNRKFGNGNGNSGIQSSGDFYPGDEWKGDVARMMMYMYLRYGSRCLPKNVGTGTSVSSDSNMINLFLQWNVEDPVNQFEDRRNNILSGIQGNRNPFVDNPAFATQIWGGPQAEDRFGIGSGNDTQAPSVPQGLIVSNVGSTSATLTWSTSSDNVGVVGYDVYRGNTKIGSTGSTTFTVTSLSSNTTYTFKVIAKDIAGNVSNASSTVSVTTLGGGSSQELFFSEYIEGSSYNKAIEIANTSGSSINLSGYSIKKQTNGSGGWSSTYNLNGSLNNGDVFVIAHSSASSAILNVADVTTGNGIVTFNGNDAIGLFKNNVLIDIIGVFNSSNTFGANVTLQRNTTSPNITYTISEWNVFDVNTFSGLGTLSGGGSSADTVVLNQASFESGWDSWSDGGGDCARYSGSRSYEGSYSIRIRDNSSTASSMTLNSVNISSYDSVEVTFNFYAYSMENGEDFWVRYNDGSGWDTVESFVSGSDFDNNNFYSATVTLNRNNYNFVNSGSFRFQCDASSNADQVYIDNVTIRGVSGSFSRSAKANIVSSNVTTSIEYLYSLDTNNNLNDLEEDFVVYPNPVTSNELNISINDAPDVSYKIVNMIGQTVKTGIVNINPTELDDLKTGLYVIEVNDGDELMSKKFLKK